MPFVILPTNSASGGYNITNSLRFNPSSSDYLNRTPASAGNRKTWTFSAWVKKSANASQTCVFSAGSDPSSNLDIIAIWDTVDVYSYSGAYAYRLTSTALFRDPSAWYHLVVALDTTQATNTNRLKLYINGTQLTDFTTTTYPTQNADSYHFNNTSVHHLGRKINEHYWNGYMSDVYFIDGQQLTPSSFGETDEDTGIWKPKAYSGTYGTNGFYLQFKNSSSLGTDSSGNGNTFTVNNLTSVDQSTDTPTNNFATWNSLHPYVAEVSFADGNTQYKNTRNSTDVQSSASLNFGLTKGKWYAEFECDVKGGDYPHIGIAPNSITSAPFWGTGTSSIPMITYGVDYSQVGQILRLGSVIDSGVPSYTSGDIIGIALDLDNGRVYFSKNGTFVNSAVPSSGTNPYTFTKSDYEWTFGAGAYDGTTWKLNTGNPAYSANSYQDANGFGNFSYSVPSGYYALCTKNLYQYGF